MIWVEEQQNIMLKLKEQQTHSPKRKVMDEAIELHDRLITTKLFSTDSWLLQTAFDHDGCTKSNKKSRLLPEVVSNQELHHLCHINGQQATNLKFAQCPHCAKCWTVEELTHDYLKNGLGISNLETFPDNNSARRLHAMIVAQQKQYAYNPDASPLDSTITHAAYDQHSSQHVKGCFKCNDKTRKRKRSDDDECRYHLPDRKRQRTVVRSSEQKIPWYDWTGEHTDVFMYDVLPQRNRYDLFQNASCAAISESALACNTNLQMQTGGPLAGYQIKYHTKSTQKDDTNDYSNVLNSMKKMMSVEAAREHNSDKRESMWVLLWAAYAHNSDNVIGAPLASHLLRYKERFIFSHEFAHLPVDHLIHLLQDEAVTATFQNHKDGSFFQNRALHYLCRSTELESVSVFDFYTQYDSVFITKENKDSIHCYNNTPHFHHPSIGKNGMSRQGVILRDIPALPKILQWALPDTACFGGSILDESTPMMAATETYAQFILTLFLPHRCNADLVIPGMTFPYTRKLHHVIQMDKHYRQRQMPDCVIFNDSAIQYLNNVQDSRSNGFAVRFQRMTSSSAPQNLKVTLMSFLLSLGTMRIVMMMTVMQKMSMQVTLLVLS